MSRPGPGAPPVVACLPAWNAERFIERTLASLAAQTYPNLEILVSDDASIDRTPEICARFAAADRRFRLLRQPRRRGWIGNVNQLLAAADGKYLFFAFHDDPLQPAYVARLVDALESNPRAVLAFSDVEIDHGGAERPVWRYTELDGVAERLERGRRLLRRAGHWWIPNRGLFRAEAARRVGGMRVHPGGEFQADWPWLLHLALLGEFVRVPEPLVRKTFRPGALHLTWRGTPRQWLGAGLACARVVLRAPLRPAERWALAASGAKYLWWHLNRRLARRRSRRIP
ncbi:glycosyltransferase family 2 protein [Pelomicrobium sp. G1]|uniref:glycosyltransferase family 2 protein n=1 Tax=unclassified Pelomicrobium TaxID=2815318 RepID=UPI003F75F66D